jgi:hypothetical protein
VSVRVITISALRGGFFHRRTSFTATDVAVYALILGLGALPFFLYEKSPDFVNDDVYYLDLAHSLLHDHSYSANFALERVQPPGLPVIVASVCGTLGCTHDTLIRTMAVFLSLGFLVSYEVIRRQRSRLIAAVSCLVLASSPDIFSSATSRLWPSFPYFFLSMLVLLLVPRLETLRPGLHRVLIVFLLCFLMTAAVITESAGIALIGGMLGCLLLSFVHNRQNTKSRLKLFLPIILIPLIAEVLWLQQGGNTRDWPLPGRGESYLSQLRLRSGNNPEMGLATPRDIVLRVEKNLKEGAADFGEILLRRWVNPAWTSPLIMVLVILIVFGVWSSLMRSRSQFLALYYVCYQSICFLWPWYNGALRFAVAVLPLACLYLAEGGLAMRNLSQQYRRYLAILFLPVSIILTFAATKQGWSASNHGLQEKMSAVFWICCVVLCVGWISKGSLQSSGRLSSALRFFHRPYAVARVCFHPTQLFVILAAAYLTATGVAADISIGRENRVSGASELQNNPQIWAARWVESHTNPYVIVASRQVGLLYHYSDRKVVWFPPISDAKVLMHGIRDHHIRYLIVINSTFNYYLPSETVCFDLLHSAYPNAFRLAEQQGVLRIYEVLPEHSDPSTSRTN